MKRPEIKNLLGTLLVLVLTGCAIQNGSTVAETKFEPFRFSTAASRAGEGMKSEESGQPDQGSVDSPTPNLWNFLNNYQVDPYLETATKLQAVGKDKAINLLHAFAKDREHGSEVYVLCRMLFTAKPDGKFLKPAIGAPLYIGFSSNTLWPLDPIELVDGVPFLIATSHSLGGYPAFPEAYLEYCVRNCDWSATPFRPKTAIEKQNALQKLLDSPKLKAANIDDAKRVLSKQIR